MQPSHNIKYFGYYSLQKDDLLCKRGIKELVRIIDTQKTEYQYAYKQFGETVKLINLEARNAFRNPSISMIKYSMKFNHYRTRNHIINNKLVDKIYP